MLDRLGGVGLLEHAFDICHNRLDVGRLVAAVLARNLAADDLATLSAAAVAVSTLAVWSAAWFGRLAFLIFHIAGLHLLGSWSWEHGLAIWLYRWGRLFISLFWWNIF